MDLALANLFSTGESIGLGVAALVFAAAGAYGIRAYLRSRPTPAEFERRRRTTLNASGKMGDANLLDLRENTAFYSYDVRGVEYHATQDISELAHQLPSDPWTSIGPVSVKYDPRNPANSILLCEEWSGLRTPLPRN